VRSAPRRRGHHAAVGHTAGPRRWPWRRGFGSAGFPGRCPLRWAIRSGLRSTVIGPTEAAGAAAVTAAPRRSACPRRPWRGKDGAGGGTTRRRQAGGGLAGRAGGHGALSSSKEVGGQAASGV